MVVQANEDGSAVWHEASAEEINTISPGAYSEWPMPRGIEEGEGLSKLTIQVDAD